MYISLSLSLFRAGSARCSHSGRSSWAMWGESEKRTSVCRKYRERGGRGGCWPVVLVCDILLDKRRERVCVRCSVLQRDAVCCSVLQCVAVCWRYEKRTSVCLLQCVAVCRSVLQCVAVCCSVWTYRRGQEGEQPSRNIKTSRERVCVEEDMRPVCGNT